MRTIPDSQLGNVQPDDDVKLESSDIKGAAKDLSWQTNFGVPKQASSPGYRSGRQVSFSPAADPEDNGDVNVSHGQIPPQAIQRIDHAQDDVGRIPESNTSKAISILNEMISKAGAAQASGNSYIPIPQARRAKQYDDSFKRDAPGIRGVFTPDKPEQGAKWPEGTDDGLERPPQNLVNPEETDNKAVREIMHRATSEAKKALAGAPRFSPGPFVSPPEKEYLKTRGYSDEEIDAGSATMSPRVRAEFNKWLTGTVRKSIARLQS